MAKVDGKDLNSDKIKILFLNGGNLDFYAQKNELTSAEKIKTKIH